MNKGLFLSLDFDFFTKEDPNWDWGHRESVHPMMDSILWHSRLSAFGFTGMDPVSATDPEVHAAIAPSRFWDVLARSGLDVSGAQLHIADSHMYGAFSHRLDGRSVVHVDAHHDLGYKSEKELRKVLKAQRADCADWLLHVLHRNRGARTEQFLSPWGSPDGDWNKIPTIARKVQQTVLTGPCDTLPNLTLTGQVDTVFIARSGAWAPPWWDDTFIQFVRDAEARTGSTYRNLDEHTDPMKTRGMSLTQARELSESMRAQWSEVRAAGSLHRVP